jgi:hypothetical protein
MEELNPAGLPVLPDSITRKLDKGQDVAVEEVREAAIDNLRSGRTNPVHAENLRPISRAAANASLAQHGGMLPRFPQTRRVIPEPFRRPRIDASRHGKTWQWVRASRVGEGDIIPGLGLVEGCAKGTRYVTRDRLLAEAPLKPLEGQVLAEPRPGMVAVGVSVYLRGAGGSLQVYDDGEEVQVFRQAPSTAGKT